MDIKQMDITEVLRMAALTGAIGTWCYIMVLDFKNRQARTNLAQTVKDMKVDGRIAEINDVDSIESHLHSGIFLQFRDKQRTQCDTLIFPREDEPKIRNNKEFKLAMERRNTLLIIPNNIEVRNCLRASAFGTRHILKELQERQNTRTK